MVQPFNPNANSSSSSTPSPFRSQNLKMSSSLSRLGGVPPLILKLSVLEFELSKFPQAAHPVGLLDSLAVGKLQCVSRVGLEGGARAVQSENRTRPRIYDGCGAAGV